MVAAGSGSRLGADQPKALVELHGTALVRRCVDGLVGAGVQRAVVTVPDGHQQAFDDVLAGVGIPVVCVAGGERRQDSVRLALAALAGEGDETVVLVHDAARPLVPAQVVGRVVAALQSGAAAAVPTMPVIDSIREGSADSSAVVDRSRLHAVQTPQGFRLGALTAAHRHVHEEAIDVTDDATVCETLGARVVLVEGHRHSLKITEPIDMLLAGAILAAGGTP